MLESFLATLADADRVAFLAELDGAVAPLAQALQREEIALEGAKAHAAPARGGELITGVSPHHLFCGLLLCGRRQRLANDRVAGHGGELRTGTGV